MNGDDREKSVVVSEMVAERVEAEGWGEGGLTVRWFVRWGTRKSEITKWEGWETRLEVRGDQTGKKGKTGGKRRKT